MNKHIDFDEYDEEELPVELRAQIERLEHSHRYREHEQARKMRRLSVRRSLEDRVDAIRMRDEIDYIH